MELRFKEKSRPTVFARIRRAFLRLVFGLLAALLLVTAAQVVLVRFFNPPMTVRMAWGWAQHRYRDKPHRQIRFDWKPLEEISPHLRRAVLAAEDQRFLNHHGFDFIELKKALEAIYHSRGIRGASTITMQVARSVYLLPSRSIGRKLAEAWYTVLIEIFWSKERILETYLNTVDWGSGIMGAEAASMRYYRIPAARLGPEQAAHMAAILPSPHIWSPARPNGRVKASAQRIIKAMKIMPLVGPAL